ncbi:MAG: hypothetical protein KAH03_06915, partial [Cocleimonas sp.]|nr:hypothetical protein [Cocleimonas sp.]
TGSQGATGAQGSTGATGAQGDAGAGFFDWFSSEVGDFQMDGDIDQQDVAAWVANSMGMGGGGGD